MEPAKPCRRCLLQEMNEAAYQEIVLRGIDGISKEDRAEEELAQQRLAICKDCEKLVSGTCLACGCYVEIRSSIRKGKCPEKKW